MICDCFRVTGAPDTVLVCAPFFSVTLRNDTHQKISMPNDQKLKTMVKMNMEQRRRLRNFHARNEEIEIGPVVASRRRFSGIERG